MRIRFKMMATVMLLVFMTVMVAGISIYGIYQNNRIMRTVAVDNVHNMIAIDTIASDIARARKNEKEFFLFSSLKNREKQEEYRAKLFEEFESTAKEIDSLKKMAASDPELARMVTEAEASLKNATGLLNQVVELLMSGKAYMDIQDAYQPYRDAVGKLEKNVEGLRIKVLEGSMEIGETTTSKQKKALMGLILLSAGVVVAGLAIGIFAAGRITKPLGTIMEGVRLFGKGELREISVDTKDEFHDIAETFNESVKKLKGYIQTEEERARAQEKIVEMLNLLSSASDGDLTQKAEVTPDIFGSIGDAFNLMVEGLADLIEGVKISVDDVNAESGRILSVLKEMEHDAEMQMVEVKKATESVDEAAISSMNITDRSRSAQKISEEGLTAIDKGSKTVLESIDGIHLIRVTIQAINKRMKYLSEKLMEIGAVSQVITEISNRTNLLAINASIEAARAGEQGKGFVIIAEEIRGLAEKSTKSTKQIGDIINTILVESAEVTKHLEEETSYVETETRMATETGTVFKEMEVFMKDIGLIISEINRAAEGQKALTSKVVLSMEEVQRGSLQMLKLVHDFSDISNSLSGTSDKLTTYASRFRLPEEKENISA